MSLQQVLITQAREQVTKLLTTEWLVSDVDKAGSKCWLLLFLHLCCFYWNHATQGDRRRRELIRIRQVYIPELIVRLHIALFTSRHQIPEFVAPVSLHFNSHRLILLIIGTWSTHLIWQTSLRIRGISCMMISLYLMEGGWEITWVLWDRLFWVG